MVRWRVRILGLALALGLAVGLAARPAQAIELDGGEGCMPYGKDWSFAVTLPEGWLGECSAEQTHGVTVAAWPAGATWPNAPALLYVTTTRREGRSLDEVMAADREEYRRHAPDGLITADSPVPLALIKSSLPVVRTQDGHSGRTELVAYGETPQVVVLMVLTADSPAALDAQRDAFVQFVRTFLPATRTRNEPSAPTGPVAPVAPAGKTAPAVGAGSGR